MFRIVPIFICSLLITTLSPNIVYAHETKEDNGTVVFLHINPNDTPIAGRPAGLRLLITSKDASFPSSNCDCSVYVIDKGRELFTQKVFTGGELSFIVPYTFSHAGIFQVKVAGRPKETSDFKPFSISFDVRVRGNTQTANVYADYIHYIVSGIALIVGGAILYTLKIRKIIQ